MVPERKKNRDDDDAKTTEEKAAPLLGLLFCCSSRDQLKRIFIRDILIVLSLYRDNKNHRLVFFRCTPQALACALCDSSLHCLVHCF